MQHGRARQKPGQSSRAAGQEICDAAGTGRSDAQKASFANISLARSSFANVLWQNRMEHAETLLARIARDRDALPRALRRVAGYCLEEPRVFISSPMRSLSSRIGVSEPTLIRFARHYGFQGLPDLRLACAMSLAEGAETGGAEPPLTDKLAVNRDAKRAIAAMAAAMVRDDRALLLDSGSTVQFMADHLADAPGKMIMTTSLTAALRLGRCDQHRLVLPGGDLRLGAMSLGGRLAERSLAEMTFDTVCIGADSIDPSRGLSTFAEDEAHLTRAMIGAARRVIVLADASKFRAPELHRICALGEIDVLITDTTLPEPMRRAVKDAGPRLLLAGPVPAERDRNHARETRR